MAFEVRRALSESDMPEHHVGWTQVRQLGNLAESGPITIARVDEPAG